MTYQGRLNGPGGPASGVYDFTFQIFTTASSGVANNPPITNTAVAVNDGLFTALVDFGGRPTDHKDYWVELAVRTNGTGGFTTLAPRQLFTATPFAWFADGASNATVAASVAAGGITASALASGIITADKLARGAVTADKLAPGAVSALGSPEGTVTNAVQVNGNGWVGVGTGTNAPKAALEVAGGPPILGPVVYDLARNGVGKFTNLFDSRNVAFDGNLLAIAAATGDGTVTLVDTSARKLSFITSIGTNSAAGTNLAGGVSAVVISTNHLMAVADSLANAVTLVNVHDPSNYTVLKILKDGVGGLNYLAGPSALAFSGGTLAVAAFDDNAVTLVDVSYPPLPLLQSVIRQTNNGFNQISGPSSVAFSGNLLAIASRYSSAVTLADVSNPSAPLLRSVLNDSSGFTNLFRCRLVAFSGNIMAIAVDNSSGQGGLSLVDVSNPAAPVLLSVIRDGGVSGGWSGTWPNEAISMVFFQRNGRTLLAAMDGFTSEMRVYDVTDPARPALRCDLSSSDGSVVYGGWSMALNADGNLAIGAWGDEVLLLGLSEQQAGLASDSWVGIGTSLPKAPLNVNGNVLVENAERFQVGAKEITLGQYASATSGGTAIGYHTTASGEGAIAQGKYSSATGDGTFAAGLDSTANGLGCVALGNIVEASGYGSIALGGLTQAKGNFATALGAFSIATGDYSLSAGCQAMNAFPGTFIWADSQNSNFHSTSSNQFCIRANGGVQLNNDTRLYFGNQIRQMINLYNADYGIGVQNNAEYFRSAGGFCWFQGGIHNDAHGNAGGGTPLMLLEGNGNLTVSGDCFAWGGLGAWGNVSAGGNLSVGGLQVSLGPDALAGGNHAVAMGDGTRANGNYSTAMGGATTAGGDYSTTLGFGTSTSSDASTSLAAGASAHANHSGCFTWGDGSATFNSSGPNRFEVLATGGVIFNTGSSSVGLANSAGVDFGYGNGQKVNFWGGAHGVGFQSGTTYFRTSQYFGWYRGGVHDNGATNAGGGDVLMALSSAGLRVNGTLVSASDRNLKENFASVSPISVLDKVAALPITEWNFKTDSGTRHLGPMAQDFHAAFGLGSDDKGIATVDEGGVALAAIQGLNQKVEEQRAVITAKEQNILSLEERLAKLERIVQALRAAAPAK